MVLVSQKLFADSAQYRIIADNSHYITIFRLVRGVRGLSTLANDIMPTKAGVELFLAAYQHATSKPYKSLHVNLSNHSTHSRLLSGILPSETQTLYTE